KPEDEQRQGRVQRWLAGAMDRLILAYQRALEVVLNHQRLTLLVAVGTLVMTALLYLAVPKGFFPAQDTGLIQAISQAAPTVSFRAMAQRQNEVVQAILEDPAVATVTSFIGIDGTNSTLNTGRMQIELKPDGERDEDAS